MIPSGREVMLLSYDLDALMPPDEAGELAATLGALGKASVHYEVLPSKFGHDTFLIGAQAPPLRQRLGAFLHPGDDSEDDDHDGERRPQRAVDRVRAVARGFTSE